MKTTFGITVKHGCPWCGDKICLMITDAPAHEGQQRRRVTCPLCDIDGPAHVDDARAIESWDRRVENFYERKTDDTLQRMP